MPRLKADDSRQWDDRALKVGFWRHQVGEFVWRKLT